MIFITLNNFLYLSSICSSTATSKPLQRAQRESKSQKEHCRGSRACRIPCGYKSKALPGLQGSVEGVKAHCCLSDLQIPNKNSQILFFRKQLTELEWISLWNSWKVDVVRTEPGQLRIPSDCTDNTGRFRDTFPAETLPKDTKSRMFCSRCFKRAQPVGLFCSHICRREKLEENSVFGYWSILKILGIT